MICLISCSKENYSLAGTEWVNASKPFFTASFSKGKVSFYSYNELQTSGDYSLNDNLISLNKGKGIVSYQLEGFELIITKAILNEQTKEITFYHEEWQDNKTFSEFSIVYKKKE
jgi:hypothetical protein